MVSKGDPRPDLKVYTFAPAWGLPSSGPFALKLLAWLNLNGVPYLQVIQNNAGKGPEGKSPWIEAPGLRLGDSDRIIAHLARDLEDRALVRQPPADAAVAHAFKTAFEERFHQILEYELMVHPAGAAGFTDLVRQDAGALAGPVGALVRRHFRKQLHARGLTRRPEADIAALGRADLDALSAYLSDRPFLGGASPSRADLAVFGQVAPMVAWPMETPVAQHARRDAVVRRWADAVQGACFGPARMPAADPAA